MQEPRIYGSVYLAGPITGTSYGESTEWREGTKARLYLHGILGYSPMRGKQYLKDVKKFTMDGDAYKRFSPLSSNRGITTRDMWDCIRHDVVLANVLGATEKSTGTTMEIAWAKLAGKPVILVIEPNGNPHDHGMITECAGFRVDNLEEAEFLAKALILP